MLRQINQNLKFSRHENRAQWQHEASLAAYGFYAKKLQNLIPTNDF